MMDSITVGAKIRMTEAVTGDYPVGSTATILYIDEMDNVFIEWSDGKLSSFSARIKTVHPKQTNDMSMKPRARSERSEWRARGFGG